MNSSELVIHHGWANNLRQEVTAIYDEAFGQKMFLAVPSHKERQTLLAQSFKPEYSFVALYDNKVVGVAGFKTNEGAFTDGINYADLIKSLGMLAGNWAALIFTLYERELSHGELILDGIAVHPEYRGKGVGTALLENIVSFATKSNYKTVRLDVIDSNIKARKLYEREGFKHVNTEHFPYLRWLLGFGSSTTLVRDI